MSTDTVLVWNVTTDEMREVARAEAAAGMARYARTLGPGSPACGEVEWQATEMLNGSRHDEIDACWREHDAQVVADADALAQWETDGGA